MHDISTARMSNHNQHVELGVQHKMETLLTTSNLPSTDDRWLTEYPAPQQVTFSPIPSALIIILEDGKCLAADEERKRGFRTTLRLLVIGQLA
ncbi:hypothetical protein BST61_g1470 [Cercospora zeina]